MRLEEKLVQLRKEKSLSQMHVAQTLEISRQAISRWEVGAALPSTDNLRKLAELYGVSVDVLLNDAADIPTMQKECREEEVLPPPTADAAEMTTSKPTGKKTGYALIAAIAALLIFLAGYLIGRYQAEKEKNKVIPISELEEMPWDYSGAVSYTYGWPEFGEGGE